MGQEGGRKDGRTEQRAANAQQGPVVDFEVPLRLSRAGLSYLAIWPSKFVNFVGLQTLSQAIIVCAEPVPVWCTTEKAHSRKLIRELRTGGRVLLKYYGVCCPPHHRRRRRRCCLGSSSARSESTACLISCLVEDQGGRNHVYSSQGWGLGEDWHSRIVVLQSSTPFEKLEREVLGYTPPPSLRCVH